MKPTMTAAVKKVNSSGVLLVFPINNRPEPDSLWSQFYPRSKMKWEWSDDGDDRVAKMWTLMKSLSDCRDVIYSKWYQGRATFFSRDLFRALLRHYLLCDHHLEQKRRAQISIAGQTMLDILEMNSPLSTRVLKQEAELQGKLNEPNYNRGIKDLFSSFFVVGFGEVDDGAFPSLALGATKLIYEDLWTEAQALPDARAQVIIDQYMPTGSLIRKYLERTQSESM